MHQHIVVFLTMWTEELIKREASGKDKHELNMEGNVFLEGSGPHSLLKLKGQIN